MAEPQTERERQEKQFAEIEKAFQSMAQMWPVMAEHAPQIASHRFIMFGAYIRAGFTEHQALELCKSSTL